MSDSEYFEAPSDSFWEISQYKRVVKRTEDGYRLSNDLMQMMSERANIEKLYSKSLKQWSKKWNEYLDKCPEYGSMKQTWNSMTTESNGISEIHMKIHDDIEEILLTDIKAWQKNNYQKTIMNTLKIVKQYEDEFAKAQKTWAKKYTAVEKSKKEYHNQCKLLASARVAEINSKTDATLSAEQKKKIEDKHEKHRKEAENAKHKYQQALDELNENNARYIEDMKGVYKKCDSFEKTRLEYFIQKFTQVHNIVDLSRKDQINSIYGDLISTIKKTHPDTDLAIWSKNHGCAMGMNWPVFEEYSEEFKNITKSEKKTKATDDNGVTMTSIVRKEDSLPEPSSLRSSTLELNKGTAKAPSSPPPRRLESVDYPSQQNPFEDDFSDEDNNINSSSSSNNNKKKSNTSKSTAAAAAVPATGLYKTNNKSISKISAPTKPKTITKDEDKAENESSVKQPSAKIEESNPFGDDDSDDDVDNGPANNNNHQNNFNRNNNNFYGSSNSNNKNSNSSINYQQQQQQQDQNLNIRVRAIYDYLSTEEDELSFKAGEEFLKLKNEDDRGWCLGRCGNKTGLYPATYAVET